MLDDQWDNHSQSYLVGGWATPPKKYEFLSWDHEIPNWMENNPHVPNHQPGIKNIYTLYMRDFPISQLSLFRRLANWGGEASLNCLLIKIWLTNAGKNLIFLRTQHPWLCLSLEKHQGHSEWMDSPATHPIPTTEILNCFNVSVQLIDIGQQTWARDENSRNADLPCPESEVWLISP